MSTLINTTSAGEPLLPCPFCGKESFELEREGTNRASSIMSCGECGCRLETNEIGYGHYWNIRDKTPMSKAFDEGVKALRSSIYLSVVNTLEENRKNLLTEREKFLK